MTKLKNVEPVAVTSHLRGFVDFIREKGVVGLAIGLALGTAASGLVTQIVGSLITPTIVLILGANGLKSLNTTVEFWDRSATYNFGDLLDAILKFIAIAAVIYFVVLGLGLDKLDKKKEEAAKKEEARKDELKKADKKSTSNEKAADINRNEAVSDAKKSTDKSKDE